MGIQRLPLSMFTPKWWKPLMASAEPSAIPSSTAGNAKKRSKKRVITKSIQPPK